MDFAGLSHKDAALAEVAAAREVEAAVANGVGDALGTNSSEPAQACNGEAREDGTAGEVHADSVGIASADSGHFADGSRKVSAVRDLFTAPSEDPCGVEAQADADALEGADRYEGPYAGAEAGPLVRGGSDGGNLWLNDDVPKSGWTCTGIDDLGAPVGICGMCGRQIIRYVHHMRHDRHAGMVGAGCICAGRMEGDPDGARKREGDFKKRGSRLTNYLKKEWKRTGKGNWALKYKGRVVTVLPDRFKHGKWKFVVDGTFSPLYDTREEATKHAFFALEALMNNEETGPPTDAPTL